MILTVILVPVVIILAIVLYANLIGTRGDLALKKAEHQATFTHNAPGYIPVGFSPSFLTNDSSNSIEYVYVFDGQKDRTLKILVEQTSESEEKIFQDYKKQGSEYLELTSETGKMLLLDQKVLVRKSDELLIKITSSEDIGTEEMIKIAEGLI